MISEEYELTTIIHNLESIYTKSENVPPDEILDCFKQFNASTLIPKILLLINRFNCSDLIACHALMLLSNFLRQGELNEFQKKIMIEQLITADHNYSSHYVRLIEDLIFSLLRDYNCSIDIAQLISKITNKKTYTIYGYSYIRYYYKVFRRYLKIEDFIKNEIINIGLQLLDSFESDIDASLIFYLKTARYLFRLSVIIHNQIAIVESAVEYLKNGSLSNVSCYAIDLVITYMYEYQEIDLSMIHDLLISLIPKSYDGFHENGKFNQKYAQFIGKCLSNDVFLQSFGVTELYESIFFPFFILKERDLEEMREVPARFAADFCDYTPTSGARPIINLIIRHISSKSQEFCELAINAVSQVEEYQIFSALIILSACAPNLNQFGLINDYLFSIITTVLETESPILVCGGIAVLMNLPSDCIGIEFYEFLFSQLFVESMAVQFYTVYALENLLNCDDEDFQATLGEHFADMIKPTAKQILRIYSDSADPTAAFCISRMFEFFSSSQPGICCSIIPAYFKSLSVLDQEDADISILSSFRGLSILMDKISSDETASAEVIPYIYEKLIVLLQILPEQNKINALEILTNCVYYSMPEFGIDFNPTVELVLRIIGENQIDIHETACILFQNIILKGNASEVNIQPILEFALEVIRKTSMMLDSVFSCSCGLLASIIAVAGLTPTIVFESIDHESLDIAINENNRGTVELAALMAVQSGSLDIFQIEDQSDLVSRLESYVSIAEWCSLTRHLPEIFYGDFIGFEEGDFDIGEMKLHCARVFECMDI